MKRHSGFTLIELLTTMAVVGVLVSVAVPSFRTTIQNGRLVTQANDLLGAFLFARSQAIAGSANIKVCASSNGTSCLSSGNSSGWKNGWLIASLKSDGTVNQVLRTHDALDGGNTLSNDAAAAYYRNVTFTNGSGIPDDTAGIYFSVCDSRGAGYGRSMYLSPVGEARISPTVGKQINGTTALTC